MVVVGAAEVCYTVKKAGDPDESDRKADRTHSGVSVIFSF